MAYSPRVAVDFVVIPALCHIELSTEMVKQMCRDDAYLVGLVTEEVNLFEPFVLNMSESVRLVPTAGEDVEGNLAANGKSKTIVGELFFKDSDEGLTDFVNLRVCGWQVNTPLNGDEY